jgi:hypothetical protein
MKRILTIAALGVALALACLSGARPQPEKAAVNWNSGPARVTAGNQATDANWNS